MRTHSNSRSRVLRRLLAVFSSYNSDHNYEITDYELLGETCEDGVIVTRTCSICGGSYSWTDDEHLGATSENIDLSEYGACGAYIYGRYCNICNTVTYINGIYTNGCITEEWITEDIVDESGAVIGSKQYVICSECNLKFETLPGNSRK